MPLQEPPAAVVEPFAVRAGSFWLPVRNSRGGLLRGSERGRRERARARLQGEARRRRWRTKMQELSCQRAASSKGS